MHKKHTSINGGNSVSMYSEKEQINASYTSPPIPRVEMLDDVWQCHLAPFLS
jgi:hypothetical protein